MGTERRSEETLAINRFDDELNEEQMYTMNKMEGYGWKLAFIRKPLFQDTVTVLFHPDNDNYGILEGDGRLTLQPDIKIRISQ